MPYEGLDQNCLRRGQREETFQPKPGEEKFTGNFKNDVYHGYGTYKNDRIFGSKWTYEGAFYVNKKHCYGILSLDNNSIFQGLYRNDVPFGPGILTDSEGRSNVGYWHGNTLIRLIQNVGQIQELSTNKLNKIKVTKFKKWVPILQDEVRSSRSSELTISKQNVRYAYSPFANNDNSLLLNKKEYECALLADLNNMVSLIAVYARMGIPTRKELIEKLKMAKKRGKSQESKWSGSEKSRRPELWVEKEISTQARYDNLITNVLEMGLKESKSIASYYTKRSKSKSISGFFDKDPAYILAWNNTEIMIQMQKHSFLSRNFEKLSKFRVDDVLCSRRKNFPIDGEIEESCVNLLTACSAGDLGSVAQLIKSNHLNVNVADNKGNPCFLRAVVNDDVDMLYLLTILGADTSIFNDEGFNALNHTLCRYIAINSKIKDWGKAFLSPNPFVLDEKVKIWMECISRPRTKSYVQSMIEDVNKNEMLAKRQYIFYVPFPGHYYKMSIADSSSHAQLKAKDESGKQEELEKIIETIKVLMDLQIDTNDCIVPKPSLILALYTWNGSILEMILKGGADPNQRLCPEEGELTCLHILSLINPKPIFAELVKILLKYGADQNAKSYPQFWAKELQFLTGQYKSRFPDKGFNPMQGLCLHSDVVSPKKQEVVKEMCKILYPISEKEFYRGYSYLSLAVAKGNLLLVETLLKLGADPNQNVDPAWGNILTTYLKHQGPKATVVSKLILNRLLEAGANPLYVVILLDIENGNTINYGLELIPKPDKDLDREAEEKLRKVLDSQQSSGQNKNIHDLRRKKSMIPPKNTIYERRVEELQILCREKVDRFVRGILVRMLIAELKDGILSDYVRVQVKNWMNWESFDQILYRNLEKRLVSFDLDLLKKALEVVPRPKFKEDFEIPTQIETKKIEKFKRKPSRMTLVSVKSIKTKYKSKETFTEICENEFECETWNEEEEEKEEEEDAFVPNKVKPKRKKSRRCVDQVKRKKKREEERERIIKELALQEKIQNLRRKIINKYKAFFEKRNVVTPVPAFGKRKEKTRKIFRDLNFYPELDQNAKNDIYRVCYQCLKRSEDIQMCFVCSLVYFCSIKCNIEDLLNTNSNHKCKCLFYGKTLPSYYYYDKDGNLIRRSLPGEIQDERRYTERKEKITDTKKKVSLMEKEATKEKTKVKKTKRKRVICRKYSRGKHRKLKMLKKFRKGLRWPLGGQWRRMSSEEERLLWRGIIKRTPDENVPWYKRRYEFPGVESLDKLTPYQQLLLVLDVLDHGDFDIERFSPWILSKEGEFYYKRRQRPFRGNYSWI